MDYSILIHKAKTYTSVRDTCIVCDNDQGKNAQKVQVMPAAIERFPNKLKPHWGFNRKPLGHIMTVLYVPVKE